MQAFVKRPPVSLNPGQGALRNDHFQVAYVTNDIERACAAFTSRYGIREFRRLEGPLPSGGQLRVELAWVGGVMYELIQGSGPGTEFYMRRLPPAGFAIRHHHLGFFVYGEAGWNALQSEITEGGWTIAQSYQVEGMLRACYIDAPELGHYLEYICPEPAGITFFESVPAI